MRAALLQMTSSDDPGENLAHVRAMLSEAAAGGAQLCLTPEVTNCLSTSRRHQSSVLALEDDDQTLAGLRAEAARLGIWLLIGSLGLKTHDPDGRFANRSFLIDPAGAVVARYDKIHMFDVTVSPAETYRESDGYRPGDRAVVADTPFGKLGMTICYDLRFSDLFKTLAQAGSGIISVPAAFTPVTGAAHWHALLRARAIETGCYILAPAQTGQHSISMGKPRATYGHSLVVSPWGEILADGGDEAGIVFADLDLDEVAQARRKIPSLTHDTPFLPPQPEGGA